LMCSCRPLQSLTKQQAATAHTAATPMEFTWNGLGNAADDCSPVLVLRERYVAGRLAFPASSLALPPTRLAPDDNGPSRHSATRRRSTSIAASGSSTHSSAPLRSPTLLPGPAHAGLLSWGRNRPFELPRTPGPIAPPSALHLLAKDRCASTPGHEQAHHLRPRDANPEVPFRPRGFSPPRRVSPRKGWQACCILQPTLGFVPFHPTSRSWPRSPRRDHPSKDDPNRPWYSSHLEPWPPWRSSLLTPNRRYHC
jgi:hypothetical protein